MHAEFTSMTAIHSIVPTLVPQVIAWGSYETVDNVHFLLCEFREMRDGLPDLNKFPSLVAQLHRNSASPNGKFGFEMATFHGQTAIDHGWSDTWEEYFARTTRVLFVKEQDVRGHNEEMAKLSRPFFDEVIPRLLTPLNTGTVKIKPALIHGDLWHGNAATDAASGEPIIFDAASFYAHNECML
jgi:fructosamine-3-kinase